MNANWVVTEGAEAGAFVGCGRDCEILAAALQLAGVVWRAYCTPCCQDGPIEGADCWAEEWADDPKAIRRHGVLLDALDRADEARVGSQAPAQSRRVTVQAWPGGT